MNHLRALFLVACLSAGQSVMASEPIKSDLSELMQSLSGKNVQRVLEVKRSLMEVTLAPDLRMESFGSTTMNTMMIDLVVQPDDLSVLLTAQAAGDGDEIGIARIVDPAGTVLYEADLSGADPVVSGPLSAQAIGNESEFGFLLPAFPSGVGILAEGTYQITLVSQNQIQNVRALFKTGSTENQTLDLNFWVADRNAALTSNDFLNNFFASLRVDLDALLNPLGLSVGEINFQVANASDTNQFAAFNTSQFSEICSAISRDLGVGRAVNIALVETISADGDTDGGIAGVAPGIPGIVLDANARRDCVLASQRAFGDDISQHAANVLHEIGHYFGLPHTTESNGTEHDRFTDTPECDAATYDGRTNFGVPGQQDGEVTDTECGREGGADNYMFWSGGVDVEPFFVSQEQAFVLARHPMFRSTATTGGFAINPGVTGSWFNAQQSGHGFLLEALSDNRLLAVWFVFNNQGEREWIIAQGNYSGNSATLTAVRSLGGAFPPNFDASQITREPWGEITFEFTDCNTATATWTASVAGFDSGSLALERLTSIDSVACENPATR